MDPRLHALAATLRMNTGLMANCLRDLSDDDGQRRVSEHCNSVTFIAAHMLNARAYLTGQLGGDGTDPFADMLSAVNSIDDVTELPTLAELLPAWHDVSERLLTRLGELTADDLDADAPVGFPIDDPTVLGMVAFLVQHDGYHLGQLGILRKQLGYEAMSYDTGGDA